MRRFASRLASIARIALVLLLVIVGSTVLVRYAPGYLSDAREMDARFSGQARAEISLEADRSRSFQKMIWQQVTALVHGDLGTSRQFGLPVLDMVKPRLVLSGSLLLRSILCGWCLALLFTLLSTVGKNPLGWLRGLSTILLAIPATAMATLCLLTDMGGPVAVLTILTAARDHKFLHAVFFQAWREPCIVQARSQGIGTVRLFAFHFVPTIWLRVAALIALSLMTALSALVPVEVLFNVPGVGQLAWGAAMNRDLPILLAVTGVMALCVVSAGSFANRVHSEQSV